MRAIHRVATAFVHGWAGLRPCEHEHERPNDPRLPSPSATLGHPGCRRPRCHRPVAAATWRRLRPSPRARRRISRILRMAERGRGTGSGPRTDGSFEPRCQSLAPSRHCGDDLMRGCTKTRGTAVRIAVEQMSGLERDPHPSRGRASGCATGDDLKQPVPLPPCVASRRLVHHAGQLRERFAAGA